MAEQLPPVDESVRVPDSVKRAAAAADIIHQQVYGKVEPTPAPAPAGDEDKPIKIVDTTPPPLPRVSTPGGDKIILPKPTPAPQPTTMAPPPATPAPQPTTNQPPPQTPPQPTLKLTPRDGQPAEPPADDNSAEAWKHKFLSMQGRYEQQGRTLGMVQEQLAQMGDEVSRLHQTVRQPAQPAQPVQPPQINFDPKDREQLGDEFLAAMARVAAATAQATLQPTVEEIRNAQRATQENVQRQMQSTAMRFVHGELDREVPAWRDINRSMEFAQWLSLPDLYSGVARGNLLRQAFAQGNANRVVAFFKGFVADATSQAVATSTQQPASQPAPNVSLLALAAPGPVKPATGSDATVPPEKPNYTRSQIRNFYDEVRRGLWANRPAEKAALEADMIAAGYEGRVRG